MNYSDQLRQQLAIKVAKTADRAKLDADQAFRIACKWHMDLEFMSEKVSQDLLSACIKMGQNQPMEALGKLCLGNRADTTWLLAEPLPLIPRLMWQLAEHLLINPTRCPESCANYFGGLPKDYDINPTMTSNADMMVRTIADVVKGLA